MSKAIFSFKGLTLVELLIVVVLLTILSAIAIPRVSQSAQESKQNICDTNVDMLNSAIEMYNADNGAYPSSLSDVTGKGQMGTEYFPDGAPECPFGGEYIMTAGHRVHCDHNGRTR